ncbi:methyltransferase type 115 [Deinococcus aerius]|uniref:Methyltransferase type 115 n=1 Tax=Deinococcus aerius TaxID=200253 RepID=A0A2I9DMB9_9DEIO|nr:class I SAM-dependent methyltransferase [Deinococcus aerius]GBF06151.1 methyltransferase type 115 [Deinococcus aerius]
MDEPPPNETLTDLNAQTRQMWERKAHFWDDTMGDGNAFQRELIFPALTRLLDLRAGERVLDVGCGNGVVSRHLAALGARVVATDFSDALLERARARTAQDARPVEYVLADATDEDQMRALGEGSFDAAVCVMALQDIADIAPLFRALTRLLTPVGRFVFAVPHPAFNIPQASRLTLEEEDRAGVLTEVRSVRVSGYLRVPPAPSAGMAGEPSPHLFFHRPLHLLLGTAFGAGLVLDGLEEPAFGGEARSARALSWRNFSEVPPVLVGRLRPRSAEH